MRRIVKNVAYLARNGAGSREPLYTSLALLPTFRRRMVDRRTELCLEGFPRSANSFALHAFLYWNPGTRVAHHLHVPMQVVRAVAYGTPCIVLIRSPLDALTSTLIVDADLNVGVAIRSYLNFYRRTWPLRDAVVVADFAQVVHSFCLLIDRLNRAYGRSFACREISDEVRDKLFDDLRDHHHRSRQRDRLVPVPTADKERRKAEIASTVQRHPAFAEAERIYQCYHSYLGDT